MGKKISQVLGPIIAVLIFATALLVLHHELRHYTYHDVMFNLKAIPHDVLVLALCLTVLNFLVLTCYDTLAVRFFKHKLRYAQTAFISFVAYAFSQGLGFPILTGGSLRYRLYSAWGLSALEIANIIAFNGLTFWMGYLVLAGVSFITQPAVIPMLLHLPFSTLRPLGVILLLIAFGYFLICFFRREPIRIWVWEFPVPTPRYFFIQICVSVIDWAVASSVLFVLLPHTTELPYTTFLSVFVIAQIAGIFSHIPGGLGVVEAIVMTLLSSKILPSQLVGALVAYRAVYYLFPLVVAAVLFAGNELMQTRASFERIARVFGKWIPSIVPQILSYSIFIAGTILLFSGATPEDISRLKWLQDFMPLPVIEISHFLGSLSGIALLLLARGIQRRLDVSYFLTAILLAGGIAFSLLKGADYEEAIILTVMLLALLPSRRFFYRKASLISRSFTPGWISAILIVLISAVWLGFFSYKHVNFSHDLWWRFEVMGNAPRFLRATVGVLVLALYFASAALLRPAPPEPSLPNDEELDKARRVIAKSNKIYPALALLGDKELLFSDNGEAFIMYGIAGRSWVCMGEPVGPEMEWPELVWRFREMADRHGGLTIFYEIESANAQLYLDLGLSLFKIGEKAQVDLREFNIKGDKGKGLRHSHNQILNEGFVFEMVPATEVPGIMPQLKEVSDAWLASKNTREKGFSLGYFKPEYLQNFPAALVKKGDRIVAFANVLMSVDKEQFSLDLMRYTPDAPTPVMDFLFLELMFYAQREGYKWFDLGMAPLAGLEDYASSPIWSRVAQLVYRYGENFYNFQGLRAYKQKFNPVWQPSFIATPGGLRLPAILADLTRLTSRGITGAITK